MNHKLIYIYDKSITFTIINLKLKDMIKTVEFKDVTLEVDYIITPGTPRTYFYPGDDLEIEINTIMCGGEDVTELFEEYGILEDLHTQMWEEVEE